jgi:hypothetical protein
MSERRTVRVTLTDVAFGLAGDAEQNLASKLSDYPSGFIARFQQ